MALQSPTEDMTSIIVSLSDHVQQLTVQQLAAVLLPSENLLLLLYISAGALCMVTSRVIDRRNPYSGRRSVLVWFALGMTVLILGLSRKMHLLNLLTSVIRDLANEQGWYESFRMHQTSYVTTVVGLSIAAYLLLMVRLRRVGWRALLAGAAVLAFCCFLIIKAASFHNIDSLLATPIQGLLRMDYLVEISAMTSLCIVAGAELMILSRPRIDRAALRIVAHSV